MKTVVPFKKQPGGSAILIFHFDLISLDRSVLRHLALFHRRVRLLPPEILSQKNRRINVAIDFDQPPFEEIHKRKVGTNIAS